MLGHSLVSLSAAPVLAGWVVPLVVALAVVEVLLDVYALFDLWRRPADQIAINKWIWVAIILLVSLFGAILYLLIGRKPGPPADQVTQAGAASERTSEIVDSLYGPPKPQP